jgi:repressor LexA
MGKRKSLSKKQQNILHFTAKYTREHKRPPTIREIVDGAELSSTSVANYNLDRLEERGYVEREAGVSRGMSLTDKAMKEVGVVQDMVSAAVEAATEAAAEKMTQLVSVPLLGNIVAGEPIEVGNDAFLTYDEDDAVSLSSSMIPGGKKDGLFALKVSGESMIDAMVNDGDIVIMRQQEMAQNGDMVAVWLNSSDTTTLKHFYHEGDQIRLQPANPTMEPIYVEPSDVRVQGKVMMVLRQTA